MTTRTEVQTEIENYIKNNFDLTPIVFENNPLNTNSLNEYTRISIQFGKTKLISIKKCYRTTGILFMSNYVKPGISTKRLIQLADIEVDLFLGQEINDITFTDVNWRKDLREVSGFVLGQVAANFYFDTIKS